MKTNLVSTLALALTITTASAALIGCGNDAPIPLDGDDGTGGTGGGGSAGTGGTGNSSGTGGNPQPGTCYDSNGKPCTGAGTTGSNWAVASGDVFKTDPYDTWSWVSSQNDAFATCFADTACKAKIVANDPAVRWQYLGDGNYSEAYSGNLGMFNLGRAASTCGYNLQVQSATEGLCWGEIKLSTGGRETFKTQKAVIGFESGDKCMPAAVIALCENAITISQFASGTNPPNPSPIPQNSDSGGMGQFFARVWADNATIDKANRLEDMFKLEVTSTVFNDRNKIKADNAKTKLPEGRTAREVIITNEGVRFLWLDGTEDFKSNATIENQGFGPSDG